MVAIGKGEHIEASLGGSRMETVGALSFDLDEEMLALLAREFDVGKLANQFAEAIRQQQGATKAVGKKIFQDYGENWMKRTIQLGEQYRDRPYEVLKAAAAETGAFTFPHIAQRFIEIAYLGAHGLSELPIVENTPRRLSYRMVECATFKALQDRCGQEIASRLPCQHACLTAGQTVLRHLGIDATVEMTGALTKDGYCQFTIALAKAPR